MSQPLISVLMPVYDAEDYIYSSLKSIVNQTYKNLQIIIVDDGSTDSTCEIIKSFRDSRISIVTNTGNIGLAASLNKAIKYSEGKYLARMDADDISMKERFEKQVAFMEANPDIDVSGTAMQYFGYSKFKNLFPASHEECKAHLLFNVCFGHPTVIFRKHIFNNANCFYKKELMQYSEEYELWCRLVNKFKFGNLNEILLKYRTFNPLNKRHAAELRRKNSFQIRKNYLIDTLKDISEEEFLIHQNISDNIPSKSINELTLRSKWLHRILILNKNYKNFNELFLHKLLAKFFYENCYTSYKLGTSAINYYLNSEWVTFYKPSKASTMRYIGKVLLKQ